LPYIVKVDHPEAGDQDVYIHGLGTFHNGTETEVSDEQAEAYRALNATQKQSDFDENGGFSVESVLAAPIDELEMRGITITKTGGSSGDGEPPKGNMGQGESEESADTGTPPQEQDNTEASQPAEVPEGAVPTGTSVVIETADTAGGNQ
jgi:hypothetical protein